MTDPIADMVTRIRNASAIGHGSVRIPLSKQKQSIAETMKSAGYLADVKTEDRDLVVALESVKGKPKVAGIKRISKPGRRVYVSSTDMPKVRQGLGIAVVSTSKGVMLASEARKQHLGGEVLVEVY